MAKFDRGFRVCAFLLLILIFFIGEGSASSDSWLVDSRNLTYRIQIIVNQTNSNINFTDFVANISIDTASEISAGRMNSICNDAIFAFYNRTSGVNTELSSYLYGGSGLFGSSSGGCNTTNTLFFVRLPEILNDNSSKYYLYFGNASADMTNLNNNTFYFYDDFPRVGKEGNGINYSLWLTGINFAWDGICDNVGGIPTKCGTTNRLLYQRGGASPGGYTVHAQPLLNVSGKRILAMFNGSTTGTDPGGIGWQISNSSVNNSGVANWFGNTQKARNWGNNKWQFINIKLNNTGGFCLNQSGVCAEDSTIINNTNWFAFTAGNDQMEYSIRNFTVVGSSENEMRYIFAATEAKDVAPPISFSFVPPTEANNTNLARSWFFVNITFDEQNLHTCVLFVNQTSNYSMTISGNTSCYLNLTNLGFGIKNYSVIANDTNGLSNQSGYNYVNISQATNLSIMGSSLPILAQPPGLPATASFTLNNTGNINALNTRCSVSAFKTSITVDTNIDETHGVTLNSNSFTNVNVTALFGTVGTFSATISCNTTSYNIITQFPSILVTVTVTNIVTGGGGGGFFVLPTPKPPAEAIPVLPQVLLFENYTLFFQIQYDAFDKFMRGNSPIGLPFFFVFIVGGAFIYTTEKYPILRKKAYGAVTLEERTRLYAKLLGLFAAILSVIYFKNLAVLLGL